MSTEGRAGPATVAPGHGDLVGAVRVDVHEVRPVAGQRGAQVPEERIVQRAGERGDRKTVDAAERTGLLAGDGGREPFPWELGEELARVHLDRMTERGEPERDLRDVALDTARSGRESSRDLGDLHGRGIAAGPDDKSTGGARPAYEAGVRVAASRWAYFL